MLKIDWAPKPSELKRFGFWMLFFSIIFFILLYLQNISYLAFPILIMGSITGLLALTGTKAGRPLYCVWMSLTLVLGYLVAPVIFFLLYYLIFTPYGFFLKLCGRDVLQLKPKPSDSYWVPAKTPHDTKRYLKQY